VSVIERGYSDDIYEYTNDLYCRNSLHEAWLLLDEHIVQLRTSQIKALDDRYKAATVDDDGQALDQFHRLPGPDLWWWRRHPRVLTGDLGVRSARQVPPAPPLTQRDPQPRGVAGKRLGAVELTVCGLPRAVPPASGVPSRVGRFRCSRWVFRVRAAAR